jgi:hypothetical protein
MSRAVGADEPRIEGSKSRKVKGLERDHSSLNRLAMAAPPPSGTAWPAKPPCAAVYKTVSILREREGKFEPKAGDL